MTTTMAKPRSKTKAVTDETHKEVIDTIRGRTLEMSFTVHGLPKSRRIGGALADTLAASVKGKKRGVRASWSMFTSEHPQVKALNSAIRDLEVLRDSWTIVKSADVKKGPDDKVTIEGGKRLIWDKDIPDFYNLFVAAAKKVDKEVAKLQHAMDHATFDADDNVVKSVKEMDRANGGDAWDEGVYPKDVTLTTGVAKERNPDGTFALGDDGNPKYVIAFNEYHVSEKLPRLLRERAIARIDAGISGTVETAMSYAVGELTESMVTFLGELSNRVMAYPAAKSEFSYLTEHGEAEVIREATAADDPKIPAGHTKAYVRYRVKEGGAEAKVTKWVGPFRTADYHAKLRPQAVGERKKIYPTVIEGIIVQLETFKDKKSKMLGAYGDNVVAAFEPLLTALTKAKATNPYVTNDAAAKKVAAALKGSEDLRGVVAGEIKAAIEALEEQVVVVKEVHRRRSIKASLVGKLND